MVDKWLWHYLIGKKERIMYDGIVGVNHKLLLIALINPLIEKENKYFYYSKHAVSKWNVKR